MSNPDTILWQSAQNILRSQENVDRLFDAFGLVECVCDDLAIEEDSVDAAEDDFLQPVWNRTFVVRRSRRSNAKVVGHLTLAIQLTSSEGMEAEWAYGKRAKALVGYSHILREHEAWVFDIDGPNAAGFRTGCISRTRHWSIEDVEDPSWFYAVPLDRLTNTAAVRRLIVAPVREILRGENVDEALAAIDDSLCLPPQN